MRSASATRAAAAASGESVIAWAHDSAAHTADSPAAASSAIGLRRPFQPAASSAASTRKPSAARP